MNRKEEYSRGLVPGLTDKDLSKEEKEQEELLNQEIARLAKQRKLAPGAPKPPAKRRKLSTSTSANVENDDESAKIVPRPTKVTKRKRDHQKISPVKILLTLEEIDRQKSASGEDLGDGLGIPAGQPEEDATRDHQTVKNSAKNPNDDYFDSEPRLEPEKQKTRLESSPLNTPAMRRPQQDLEGQQNMQKSNLINLKCPMDEPNEEKRMPKPKPVPTQGGSGAEPNLLSTDAAPD